MVEPANRGPASRSNARGFVVLQSGFGLLLSIVMQFYAPSNHRCWHSSWCDREWGNDIMNWKGIPKRKPPFRVIPFLTRRSQQQDSPPSVACGYLGRSWISHLAKGTSSQQPSCHGHVLGRRKLCICSVYAHRHFMHQYPCPWECPRCN